MSECWAGVSLTCPLYESQSREMASVRNPALSATHSRARKVCGDSPAEDGCVVATYGLCNWGGLRLGFRRTQGCETGRKRVPGSHPSALSAPRGVGRRRRSRSRVSALSGGPRSSLRLASFKDTPDNRSVNFSDGHASSDAGITRVSCFVRTTQRKKGSAGGPYGPAEA